MRRRIVGVLASAITALGAVAVAPDAPAVKPGGPAVTTGAVAFAGSGLTAGANGARTTCRLPLASAPAARAYVTTGIATPRAVSAASAVFIATRCAPAARASRG